MNFFGVTEEQLTVAAFAQFPSSGLGVSGVWLVTFEIVADLQSADQLYEALENVARNDSSFAQSMGAVFADNGLEMEESSVSVIDPVMMAMIETMTTAMVSVTMSSSTPTITTGAESSTSEGTRLHWFLVVLACACFLVVLACLYVSGKRICKPRPIADSSAPVCVVDSIFDLDLRQNPCEDEKGSPYPVAGAHRSADDGAHCSTDRGADCSTNGGAYRSTDNGMR
jgi:hypothetical protein